MIQLYDTAQQKVLPLQLRDPGKVSMYVCGPTVYGPPHIGHGRMTLVFDIIRRYLAWSGLDVTFVSNITDIDDQIINRANREGRDAAEIAVKCESIWWQAMDSLNVLRPDHTPHATEYVEEMVELIERLVADDKAYATADGVYLSVETVDGYGLLAHQSLDQLIEGGGDRAVVGVEKRHPGDFALWKVAKEGEPSWPSPWGPGRPGWHTECVVMSLDLLGEGFDLHCGGQDLRFPHHENERAQAVALGKTFANHWMHHAFVDDAEGEKMSRSLGNVLNMLDLLDRYDERAYRMLLLQTHYRSPVRVSIDSLESSQRTLAGLDAFAARSAALPAVEADRDVLDRFRASMDADLDTPAATALLFDSVRAANVAIDAGKDVTAARAASTVGEMCVALGLELRASEEVPADVAKQVAALDAARAAKEYGAADAIRAELQADGWTVETTKDGTAVRR